MEFLLRRELSGFQGELKTKKLESSSFGEMVLKKNHFHLLFF